jgi:hypothetical protein
MTIDSNSQYSLLAARRESSDTMLWQAPVLSVTAQAFLLNIALTSTEWWPIIVSSLLSLTSLGAIHLMMKHRYFEVKDSILLDHLESKNQKVLLQLNRASEDKVIGSSYDVWLAMLVVFGVAAICGVCRAIIMIKYLDLCVLVVFSGVLVFLTAAGLYYLVFQHWYALVQASLETIKKQNPRDLPQP